MTTTDRDARTVLDAAMTERQLQDTILRMAKATGWLCFHAYDSRRSQPGFPDLCCVHQNPDLPIVFAELKRQKGILGPLQQDWLDMLHRPPAVIAECWRPSDLSRIESIFTGTEDWMPGERRDAS